MDSVDFILDLDACFSGFNIKIQRMLHLKLSTSYTAAINDVTDKS